MNNLQRCWGLVGIIFFLWLLVVLSPVLTPFIIAALLAYLGDPLIDRLEEKGLSRTISVAVFFIVMLLLCLPLLLIIIPQLEEQSTRLVARFPQFINWVQENFLPRLTAILGVDLSSLEMDNIRQVLTQHMQEIGNITSSLLVKLGQSGQIIITWFAYLLLIPVVTFYLLRDWDLLVSKIHDLIPKSYQQLVTELAIQCDSVLAEFLRGQLLVMLAQAILYSLGLWIVGIEAFLLIGFLTGLLSFVPYLGFIVGIGVASIAGFMQFQDLIHLLYIFAVFGIVQTIESVLLSPLLIGERVGLHPVAVIFAVMAGGQLFGFLGVLLALPVAAVIVVLLRRIHRYYLSSELYTL